MKPIRFASILLVLAACGGSGQLDATKAGYEEPSIKFVDFSVGPQIPVNRGTQLTFNAGLRIKNSNSFTIHARQIRVNLGGSVSLQMDHGSRVLDVDIAGGTSRVIPVDFTAFTRAETIHLFPLNITGRVFFDSPNGSFSVPVVQSYSPEDQEQKEDPEDPDAVD